MAWQMTGVRMGVERLEARAEMRSSAAGVWEGLEHRRTCFDDSIEWRALNVPK